MIFFKKRKGKKLKKIKLFVFLFLIIIAIIWLFPLANRSNKNSSEVKNKELKIDSSPKFEVNEHIIGGDEVFYKLNTALGLSVQELETILRASVDTYDLSQIKAGNKIKALFDYETKKFKRIEYEIDADNLLVVKKMSDETLKAYKKAIEYEIQLIQVAGKVESSLYQTGQKIGLPDKIIMEMADVFAWDVDFVFDVREGDKFKIVYEKKYLDGKETGLGKILAANYQNQDKIFWAIYYKDQEGRGDYYSLDGKCLRRQFLKAPLSYRYISSGYTLKRYHPVWKIYTTHKSVDYAAACGTPISAAGAGTIISIGWNKVYGNTITIRHNDVYNTRYGHLSSYAKGMKYGAKVTQGMIIGYVGTTGASTGCHLDYGMSKYGNFINPLTQNFERSDSVKSPYFGNFEFTKDILIRLLNEIE